MPNPFRYFLNATEDYRCKAAGVREQLAASLPDDLIGDIARRVANREQAFLSNTESLVFSNPGNLYHEMFRLAGCESGDLAALVGRRGLAGALAQLRENGVYLSHEEFKGRQPVVRQGRELRGELSNPRGRGVIPGSSSGSSGAPVTTYANLEFVAATIGHRRLLARELGLDERKTVVVHTLPPSMIGVNACLYGHRIGKPVDSWFAQDGGFRRGGRHWAAIHYLMCVARWHGARVPFPRALPEDDYTPAAGHVAWLKRRGHRVVVDGMVSACARVAEAASRNGLDIAGTYFIVNGEALTDAKRKVIEAAGCEPYPTYWIHETGAVFHAATCATAIACTCSRIASK